VHFGILSDDDALVRVLSGAADRLAVEVTAARPSDVEALRRHPLDAVILDEERLSPAVGTRLHELRRALGRVHTFLLLEHEPYPAPDVPSDPGARDHDTKRAQDLGVCLVQRKPFHPSEFLRLVIRTIAQEEAGLRDCAVASHSDLAGPRADGG